MSLLSEFYETLKDKQIKNFKINFEKDNLHLLLFPTDSYRIEQLLAMEEDKSINYSTLVAYNSFDTFLIDNRKFERYKPYFELEPLKSFRSTIEETKKETDLERKNGRYIRAVFINKNGLNEAEIKNALAFFAEIFQDKLKNPNDFQWHLFYSSLNPQKI
ncbi:MAG: hypothetical protein N3G19_01670 [Candidatus Pacearchaeota archaeon]|nr:hypothetical protein [Candidatus Pacearchaeota archaeon]